LRMGCRPSGAPQVFRALSFCRGCSRAFLRDGAFAGGVACAGDDCRLLWDGILLRLGAHWQRNLSYSSAGSCLGFYLQRSARYELRLALDHWMGRADSGTRLCFLSLRGGLFSGECYGYAVAGDEGEEAGVAMRYYLICHPERSEGPLLPAHIFEEVGVPRCARDDKFGGFTRSARPLAPRPALHVPATELALSLPAPE